MRKNFIIAWLLIYCLTSALTASFTCPAEAQTAKTHVVDFVRDAAGNPVAGKVTFILTQKATTGDGLIVASPSVSATLDSTGQFSVYLYPSASLSPASYYQVYVTAGAGSQTFLGIYSIPASSSIVTLSPNKVLDTNLAAQYTFAPQSAIVALSSTISTATFQSLLSSSTDQKIQKYDASAKGLRDSALTETSTAINSTKGISAPSFTDNGAGLTGIPTGTGGVSNSGSTTICADCETTPDGIGVIDLMTRNTTRLRVENDGSITTYQPFNSPTLSAPTINNPNVATGTSANFFGDSNTFAFGASDAAHGYASMVAAAKGWTAGFHNYAVSGSQCGDQQDAIYSLIVGSTASENNFNAVGIGDEVNYGTDANKRLAFQRCYLAELGWMALPNTAKAKGNTLTTTGTWTATPTSYAFGIQSIVNGSTASKTVAGQWVFIWYLQFTGGTATATVTIDGTNYGTISTAPPGNVSVTTSGFTRPTIPGMIPILMPTSGPHSVVVNVTSAGTGNPFYLDAIGGSAGLPGIASVGISSPNVYALELTGLTAQGYIDHGGSDANNGLYNEAIKADVELLRSAGLNVALVPIASAVNPATDYFDWIHWGNPAQAKIGDMVLAIVNQSATARNKDGLGRAQNFNVLSGSSYLDFGALAGGACETITITGVWGALAGDGVQIGWLPSQISSTLRYDVFVSAPGVISVQRCNLSGSSASDPAPVINKYWVLKSYTPY